MQSVDERQPTFEDLELLAEVSQLLTLTDVDNVLQRVIHLASTAVGADRASLFLQAGGQVDWNHIFTMRDLSEDESVRVVTKVLDDGFAGWVVRHQRGDIITDTQTDDRWIVFPDDPVIVRSALCVPFMDGDNVIATVTLVHHEPNHFATYHLRLMMIIANQATIAIRNAQLVNRLRDQRRQLETIIFSISDAVLVLSDRGEILMINMAGLDFLDTPDDSGLLGKNLSDFIAFDSVFAPIMKIIEQGDSKRDEWELDIRSDRKNIDFVVKMAHWRDNLQGIIGYVIVMHDVTQLRDLHRFKDEMLRVASHDLRSPLALISGYADMVGIDTMDPTSPVHEYVGIIKQSVERMGGLIDDLLRVERIRNSPLELHEQTDLEALVKVVVVNMRPSITAKHQTFETDVELAGCPRIVADTVLMRQSMENLISNATKYTQEGGVITLRSYYDDHRFYFEVTDNGIGIPDEAIPYVFESFYRVQHISNKQKGSGLGLSLVKNVIMRHGGDVWIKSKLGAGSTFGFWLPLPERG